MCEDSVSQIAEMFFLPFILMKSQILKTWFIYFTPFVCLHVRQKKALTMSNAFTFLSKHL